MNLNKKYPDYYSKVVGFIGTSNSDTSTSLSRYAEINGNKIVVSSRASSATLDTVKNFCRTIPNDNEQINVIKKLLIEMKWDCIYLVYSDSNYGTSAFNSFNSSAPGYVNFTGKLMPTNNIAAIENLVFEVEGNTNTGVIVFFCSDIDLQEYFKAAQKYKTLYPNSTNKIYIGSDTWVRCIFYASIKVYLL